MTKKIFIGFVSFILVFTAINIFAAFINTDAVTWDFPTTYQNGVPIPSNLFATSEVALSATNMDLNLPSGAYIVKKIVSFPGNKLNLSDLFPLNKPIGSYHIWVRLTTTDTNIATSVWTKLPDIYFDRVVLGEVPNIRIVPR